MNIYIKPQRHEGRDDSGLEDYMKNLYEKYARDEHVVIQKSGQVYPYISVDDEDICLYLGIFYNLHYIKTSTPAMLLNIDIHDCGEKTYSEILEDAKTAVKFLESEREEI